MKSLLTTLIAGLVLLFAAPSNALDLRAPALAPKPTVLHLAGSAGDAPPALLSPLTLKVFGAGVGAAAIMVPGTLALGTWMGGLTSNLYAAALPPVLLFLALPPLAVTFAEWLMGRLYGESFRWGPALAVGVGTQLLLTASAFLFGVSTNNPGNAALFTLAEMILLPAAVTLTMHYSRPSGTPVVTPMPTTPTLTKSDPFNGVVVPLASVGF